MDRREFDALWKGPVNRIGMSTLLLAVILSFIPVAYLYFTHGVFPDSNTALKAWGMIASMFGAFYFVEPISYFSTLGLSGTYMSFLSGNIGNCRLPAAAMALEVTETEPGTIEAEIISTIGIAGSIIINIIGTTLCAFVGVGIINLLPTIVVEGLKNYTAPAIFGAMFGQFAIKYPKLAVFGIGIPVLIRLIFPTTPAYFIIIPSVFGTIIIARLFYNKEKTK
ncbi:MAG: hypothetical protein L5655_04715 [Thermosediminibacteraceae bacterium]|nr:hypothetical protein [Thermosediminibacteraceae bacterium]